MKCPHYAKLEIRYNKLLKRLEDLNIRADECVGLLRLGGMPGKAESLNQLVAELKAFIEKERGDAS